MFQTEKEDTWTICMWHIRGAFEAVHTDALIDFSDGAFAEVYQFRLCNQPLTSTIIKNRHLERITALILPVFTSMSSSICGLIGTCLKPKIHAC
jgi:hypothetical protein